MREALWFDLSSPETPDHHSLSAWRAAPLDYAAVMLGVTHLIAAIALFVLHPEQSATLSFANPILPMALLLSLDLVAIAGLHWRDRLGLEPHNVVRALAAYLAAVGTLWIMVGLAITPSPRWAIPRSRSW